jgi:hypothetical protein
MTVMRRLLPLLFALAGCAGPGVYRVQGTPVQQRWEVVVQAAYDSRPCTFNWTHFSSFDSMCGVITFHDGPFSCLGASGTDANRLCNGRMDGANAIHVNGAQTPDVLAGTLPWEMGNVLAWICFDDASESRTMALAATITDLARSRLP